ncbi:alanine racemase, partial [Sinorhizobium medicae]
MLRADPCRRRLRLTALGCIAAISLTQSSAMQNSDFSSASSRLTVDLAALADNWRMMNERSG